MKYRLYVDEVGNPDLESSADKITASFALLV
jgi:hypothetical protein